MLRTGFAEMVLEMQRQPDAHALHHSCCALDGRDARLLQWITDSGIAALAAELRGRTLPGPAGTRSGAAPAAAPSLPVQLGLPLGELWYLRELAARLRTQRRTRFFLTAPPLRLPGALGSPVTPVATV